MRRSIGGHNPGDLGLRIGLLALRFLYILVHVISCRISGKWFPAPWFPVAVTHFAALTSDAACKIYVGNLLHTVTSESVSELFSQHGKVHSVALTTDRESGRLRGFGFVEMDDEAATAAIKARSIPCRSRRGRGTHPFQVRLSTLLPLSSAEIVTGQT